VQLGDVRSWDEYVGSRHDYTYFDALGRIPGSKWVEWGR
jgi:3-mercaptopyruvate sulfurtransferase SseA